MAALTILDYATAAFNQGAMHKAGVLKTFAEQNDVIRVLPFVNIAGNAIEFNRETGLPSTAFRAVNGSYTANKGAIEKQKESLFIAGGDLDVDRYLVETMGPSRRTAEEMMKVTSLAQTIGHKIVKGSSATANTEFDGLQIRCNGTQLLAAGATAGGDVLSLAKLDELIDKVDNPTHLIMSKAMRRTLTAAARLTTVGGFITYGIDEFGRQVTKYADLPILIADQNSDLFATLAFDEAAVTSGTSATSIYCVSIGEGRLYGIQSKPIDVRDLGELDSAPVFRTRVEWYVSLVMEHPRSAARLWSIKTGAAVA